MARVVVYAMAYRGDVHPFAPIATELVNRGHDVTFVLPDEFHAEFAAEPFECRSSGTDFAPKLLNTHGEWIAKWGMRFGGALLLRLYFGQLTVPHLDTLYNHIADATADADVLLSHPAAASVGSMAAEAHGIPWISGQLFPMLVPTSERPPLPTAPSLGPTGNRLLWKLAQGTRPYALSYANAFADFRRIKGLDDTPRSPLSSQMSPWLTLGLSSQHYTPRPADAPKNYQVTGFTHWSNDDFTQPEGLDDFLDAGEPPVLITYGTLGASSFPERFEEAVRAAAQLGRRTISLCSTPAIAGRLRATIGADRHGVWPFAPLARVLPRCEAVVHSGAHGTNSMTLAAGLPSVVMPAIFDQVWHASRQQQLGTGVWVRGRQSLQNALDAALNDRSYRAEAADLGARIRSEDGTAATVAAIEQFLGQPSSITA